MLSGFFTLCIFLHGFYLYILCLYWSIIIIILWNSTKPSIEASDSWHSIVTPGGRLSSCGTQSMSWLHAISINQSKFWTLKIVYILVFWGYGWTNCKRPVMSLLHQQMWWRVGSSPPYQLWRSWQPGLWGSISMYFLFEKEDKS